MLPTQANFAMQTDILPTQNIALPDQNQPQIYSLLASSTSPPLTKQLRRNKTTKLDEPKPVMINPQITRTPTGITFTAPHHRSTTPSEPISPFVSTRFIHGHTVPFRLYLEHNSYDTNNNISNNQIPSFSMSRNPSLPAQTQQIPAWSNESLPTINTNSIPQSVTKPPLFGLNRLLDSNINERIVPVPSPRQSEYKHLSSSLPFIDQESLLNHSHSFSSPISSISASDVPLVKPKRKYSKRQHPSALVKQQQQQQTAQQTSPYLTSCTQPTLSNDLPSMIPPSVTATATQTEKQPLPIEIPTASSFVALTPPASINSVKSPPTNVNTESSLMPIQQHLPPYTATDIIEVNSISKKYFPDQRFPHTQKPINDSSTSNLSYNLHRFFTAAQAQYCMVPSNLLPTNMLSMTCSSILPGTVASTASVSTPPNTKKERKKREKGARKSKVMQKPTVAIQSDEQSLTSRSLTTDISVTKKRNHKNSDTKDLRTKKQLRRFTRQNRLAVLKFMMRKRRQQKQHPVLVSTLSDTKVEQVVPKLISTDIVKSQQMETNLPDIIAPSLKISFDANQKIESISLYYHRRRKLDLINESSPKSLTIADNKLGLLVEAVDFIETLQGSLKLALPSNK